jgi:Mrp family chromosome partitioning ATPase
VRQRGKTTLQQRGETPSLEMAVAGGQARLTFASEVVRPLRHMVTRLAQRGELPQRLSVVSALRQEGVTYIALALASTIAHDLAATVCVVELNAWWPGLASLLDVAADHPARAGLAAVIGGQAALDEALLPTIRSAAGAERALPGPTVLLAGEIPVDERPIVARSAALGDIVSQLSQRFAYVVLDVPAILSTSDAIPLASLGNACCVVVCQGTTSVNSARQALDDIEHLRIIGAILNQVRIATPRVLLKRIPQE